MSWLGLRHKGVEVLYPDEWNKVVDGLDILKYYADSSVKFDDLTKISSDVAPKVDGAYNLGEETREWKNVYAYYGYFKDNVYVNGSPVLKDGDPVQVYRFIDEAKQDIDNITSLVTPPTTINPWRVEVSTAPVPLSSVPKLVKRILVKIPSWSPYFVYLGSDTVQDFILEPKDIVELRVNDPSKVYVRSLGNVTIFVAVEE